MRDTVVVLVNFVNGAMLWSLRRAVETRRVNLGEWICISFDACLRDTSPNLFLISTTAAVCPVDSNANTSVAPSTSPYR
jgi:hypothetical protein